MAAVGLGTHPWRDTAKRNPEAHALESASASDSPSTSPAVSLSVNGWTAARPVSPRLSPSGPRRSGIGCGDRRHVRASIRSLIRHEWEARRVQVKAVDPRDTRWEDHQPVFRVYFWDGGPEAWSSDEYEVDGADVTEVLSWAWSQLPSKGTEFALYLRRSESSEPGLVLLAGRDPSEPQRMRT